MTNHVQTHFFRCMWIYVIPKWHPIVIPECLANAFRSSGVCGSGMLWMRLLVVVPPLAFQTRPRSSCTNVFFTRVSVHLPFWCTSLRHWAFVISIYFQPCCAMVFCLEKVFANHFFRLCAVFSWNLSVRIMLNADLWGCSIYPKLPFWFAHPAWYMYTYIYIYISL